MYSGVSPSNVARQRLRRIESARSAADRPPRSHVHNAAWRHAARRLPLDARQELARAVRLPGSRERLHRRRHGAHRRVADQAVRRDALPHPGDRRERPLPPRRLVLLHAHGRGQPISHPLPTRRSQLRPQLRLRSVPARADHPRRKRAGRGQALHGRRSHGRQSRRQPPRIHHRFHRLPPVHAAPARPAHARRPPRHSRARRIAGLGRRLAHPLLLHRGRDHQAPGPHPAPRARHNRRRRQPRLPRRGRAFQPRRFPHPRRPLPHDRVRQPHHQRVPLSARRRTTSRPSSHRSTRGRTGVLPGPSGRSLHHPQQRRGQELPRRHRAGRHAWPRPLGRS